MLRLLCQLYRFKTFKFNIIMDNPFSSANFVADAGVFTYFSQSNFAGQLIVLALILFSLVAWTLMISKYLELNKLRQQNALMNVRFSKASSVLSIPTNAGPFSDLLEQINTIYAHFIASKENKSKALLLAQIENGLHRGVAKHSIAYESKMVILGSIISGAPFLGLLGTVWGVMDAFGNIALQSSTSLQNLAPGVSGALLTTVAALLVAIPSVFGYNFLVSQTKQMVVDLENFASALVDKVELEMNE